MICACKPAKLARRGYTLGELMIVVAIISILIVIAIPKFADILRKSNEGSIKGNLASLRSALTLYCASMEGYCPIAYEKEEKAGKKKKKKKKNKKKEGKKKGKIKGETEEASTVLEDALVPKFIAKIPPIAIKPYHKESNKVGVYEFSPNLESDDGYWGYDGFSDDPHWGTLWISCKHTDTKGKSWSAY